MELENVNLFVIVCVFAGNDLFCGDIRGILCFGIEIYILHCILDRNTIGIFGISLLFRIVLAYGYQENF